MNGIYIYLLQGGACTKFGVAEYAAPTKLKIKKPLRPPELTFEPHEPDAQLACWRRRVSWRSSCASCEAVGSSGDNTN